MRARLRRLLGDDGPMGRTAAAVILVTAWVSTWRPQIDPDAWWHLAYGELIGGAWAIPASERFSWLTEGIPIVLHSWLADVLLSGANQLAGPTGMSLLLLPVVALIVILLWMLVGLAAGDIAPIGRAVLVLVAVVAAVPSWGSRGQTLDAALVFATVLVIGRYIQDGKPRVLIALPIIAVAWANLHGSGVPALVACLAIGLLGIEIGRRDGRFPDRPLRPLALASTVSIAATLVNPYGLRLLTYPLDRGVASAFATEIVEWRPPDFGAPELLVARLVLALTLVAMYRARTRLPHPFVILVAAAWVFMALGAARFLPIAMGLLVAVAAPSVIRRNEPRDVDVEAPTAERPQKRPPSALLFIPTALIVTVLLIVGWSFIAPPAQVAAIAHRMPVAATSALRSNDCPGRLLVAYGWGGFVIRFADRTVGAYGNSPEGAVIEQTAVELVMSDPRAWLDARGVDAILMPGDGPLSRWLDEADGWELRYRDDQATVHARSGDDRCRPTGWVQSAAPAA